MSNLKTRPDQLIAARQMREKNTQPVLRCAHTTKAQLSDGLRQRLAKMMKP